MITVAFFTENDENIFSVSTDSVPQVGDIVIYRLRCERGLWEAGHYDPERYEELKALSGLRWVVLRVVREFHEFSSGQIDQRISVYVRPAAS